MKKNITLILLILSVIPFAFWKMEKKAGYQCYYPESINDSSYLYYPMMFRKDQGSVFFGINYLFSYNKDTGYAIAYTNIHQEGDWARCVDFFREGDPSIFMENHSRLFIFIEEFPNLKMSYDLDTGSSAFSEWENITSLWTEENCFNPEGILIKGLLQGTQLFYENSCEATERREWILKDEFLDKRALRLSKEFKTSSGIIVSNKEEYVEISQEGKKPHNFQKLLEWFFDIHNRNIRIAHDVQSGKFISAKLLNSLKFKPTVQEIDLLNKSNILAVFGIFKKKGIESIIWGLAQDKDTKKKFHWVTNLEVNICSLIF